MKKLFLLASTLISIFVNAQSVPNQNGLNNTSIISKNWQTANQPTPNATGSDLTTSGANTTWTIASNKLHVVQTGGQGTASEYAYFNQYKTNLEDFTIESTFQQTAAIGASTYGPAFGIQNSQYNFFALIFCSTTLNGKIRFYQTSGAGAATPVVITTSSVAISGGVAQNDILNMRIQFVKNVVTVTVTNLTTSGQPVLSLSYTFPMHSGSNVISGQPVFMPASGFPAIFSIGGTSDIEYFNYSRPKKKARTLFIGDSILRGYYSATAGSPNLITGRLADLLYTNSDYYIMQSGPGNECSTACSQLQESVSFNAQYAVVCLGVNDVIDGVSLATTIKNILQIVQTLQDCGTKVVLLNLPPVNTYSTNINAVNTALSTMASNNTAITLVNINTPLNNGSGSYNPSYTDDNIHPNQAGEIIIQTAINSAISINQ